MLYIVTALKSEAQAFVDRYRLTKTRHSDFTVFSGEKLKLVVSGIGIECSKKATYALIQKFNPSNSDIFVNVGICGASEKYKIGELIKIGSIIYKNEKFIVDKKSPYVTTCTNIEVAHNLYEIADMESFGFYEATTYIKNRHIYKVVSDHFEPDKVTRDGTKKLILNAIDEIVKEVEN